MVLGPHGLRGLLRVHPYDRESASLAAGRALLLEHGGRWHAVTLEQAAPTGRGHLLVAITGVTDRTAAEQLARARLLVRRADLAPLAADEFYHHEILGFAVDTIDGRHLGEVAETLETGLNDVWVVRDGPREHLIPVIADVVRSIDRDARRILIEPLPGLLD